VGFFLSDKELFKEINILLSFYDLAYLYYLGVPREEMDGTINLDLSLDLETFGPVVIFLLILYNHEFKAFSCPNNSY
jgi:hypothetical protein